MGDVIRTAAILASEVVRATLRDWSAINRPVIEINEPGAVVDLRGLTIRNVPVVVKADGVTIIGVRCVTSGWRATVARLRDRKSEAA